MQNKNRSKLNCLHVLRRERDRRSIGRNRYKCDFTLKCHITHLNIIFIIVCRKNAYF